LHRLSAESSPQRLLVIRIAPAYDLAILLFVNIHHPCCTASLKSTMPAGADLLPSLLNELALMHSPAHRTQAVLELQHVDDAIGQLFR